MGKAWRFTPQQIDRAARGQKVPGLTDGLLGKAARSLRLGNVSWQDFEQARKRGYLWLPTRWETDSAQQAAFWWGWWCMACRVPEAVIRLDAGGRAALRFDLSPAGRLFLPTAILPIGQAVREAAPSFDRRWIVSPDTVEVDELDAEGAHALAQALLLLAEDARFAQPERHLPPTLVEGRR